MKKILLAFCLLIIDKSYSQVSTSNLIVDIYSRSVEQSFTNYKVKNTYDRNNNLISYEIIRTCSGFYTLTYMATPQSGASYQWQIDIGTGFVNLAEGGFYAGTQTATLIISNAPTALSGKLVRCLITVAGNSNFSQPEKLSFKLQWTGAVSTDWHDPANWNCSTIPDAETDVLIPGGLVNYPSITTAAFTKSITSFPGALVIVQPGASLAITGR